MKFNAYKFKRTENKRALRLVDVVMKGRQAHEPVEGVEYRESITGRKRPVKPKAQRKENTDAIL